VRARQNARLVVVGGGPELPVLQALATRLGVVTLGAPADQHGALDTITRLDLTWLGNARRVVTLAQSARG